MNINQVRYILAVAQYGSLSEASHHLYVSQPSLSQQIQALETELGYTLFVRSPKGVILTEAGRDFCRCAREAVDSWEKFERSVHAVSHQTRTHLKIGMGSRVYSNGLFDKIILYFDRHPELEVTFVTEAGRDFVEGLRTRALDLALDRLPPAELSENRGDIDSCDLIQERQCVLMAPDDPRRKMERITFSDLSGCTMMTGLENSIEDRTLKNTCLKCGISLKRIYRSDSIETVMALVRSGKGIIFGPQSFAGYFGVAAVPLFPEANVSLNFICLKENSRKQHIAKFRAFMQEICQAQP